MTQRRGEIGLLRALGARRRQILLQFLGDAMALALLGGSAGLATGSGGAGLIALLVPEIPARVHWNYALLAQGIAGGVGLISGVFPAWGASRLDPVESLRAE